jgi:hypothetical protein
MFQGPTFGTYSSHLSRTEFTEETALLLFLPHEMRLLDERQDPTFSIDSVRLKACCFCVGLETGLLSCGEWTVLYLCVNRTGKPSFVQIKNVMDACLCGVAFWSFGWAIGFGDGSRFIGWKNPSEKLAIFDAGDQVCSHLDEPRSSFDMKNDQEKEKENTNQIYS